MSESLTFSTLAPAKRFPGVTISAAYPEWIMVSELAQFLL